jgi:glycosyltransferase involved in cell wall biosynthesis
MPEQARTSQSRAADGSIAYILKGFPRMSETFIAGEIYRLEQAGIRLRLFVIKQDEVYRHPVVDRIRARPDYLPATSPLSRTTPLRRWLASNLGNFRPALRRTARRRRLGLVRAATAALAQAMRARAGIWSRPRGVYLKEFLQSVALADRLLDAPDVRHLHAHFAHGATTVAWLASSITGLPFSFTAHATDIYRESLNPAGLLRRKLAAATFAVTCTESNRKYLQALAGQTPVHCIYHGLNVDFSELLARAPKSPPPKGGCLRVLGVGRLVPKKGFDTLVEACGLLHRRGVHLQAVIVGETGGEGDDTRGPIDSHGRQVPPPGSDAAKRQHADEIRCRIAALGLDQSVRLAGPMGQAELFQEYRRATVLCLPCRILEDGDRDGIPNVLVEAMACGLPVVTTNVSGIPELVCDGVNGLLVPPDNPQAVAEALLRVHCDRALASRLEQNAAATVRERFDGDALAQRLASLFREVVA